MRQPDNRGARQLAAVVAAWLGIMGASVCDAQSSAAVHAADSCHVAPAAQLSITADSVGPLEVWAPLRELLRRCPAAYIDTTRAKTIEDHPQAEPQVVFPFPDLYVSAIAAGTASVIDSTLPVHLWVMRGSGAWLPRGLRSDATWRELVAAYGARGALWVDNGFVNVGFCAVRGLVFYFRAADYAQPGLLQAHQWETLRLTRIPDPLLPDARIRAITFVPQRAKTRC